MLRPTCLVMTRPVFLQGKREGALLVQLRNSLFVDTDSYPLCLKKECSQHLFDFVSCLTLSVTFILNFCMNG